MFAKKSLINKQLTKLHLKTMAAKESDTKSDVDNVDGLLSCFRRQTPEDTVDSEPYSPSCSSDSIVVKPATVVQQGPGTYKISPGLNRGNALISLYLSFYRILYG